MRTRGLLVKLYTNSQDFARFEDLQEGHVVLLTDLKLLVLTNDNDAEAADDSERQGRPPPVSARSITLSRSTNFTQIYIFDQSPVAAGDDAVEAQARDVQARYLAKRSRVLGRSRTTLMAITHTLLCVCLSTDTRCQSGTARCRNGWLKRSDGTPLPTASTLSYWTRLAPSTNNVRNKPLTVVCM